MEITIVIPTYKRIKKLTRCIDSILNQTYRNFNIFVMPDNDDLESHEYISNTYKKVESIFTATHKYGPGSWQWFLTNKFTDVGDIFLGLVDDCELYPNCLDELVYTFETNFNNTDGVVGLSQKCPGRDDYTWKEFGIMGFGRKFLESFPNQEIKCPDYVFLYQDEELYNYLKLVNKFKLSEDAILNHYHPCFVNEMDNTHSISRGKIAIKDKRTYEKRQSLGLIWGETFELINEDKK